MTMLLQILNLVVSLTLSLNNSGVVTGTFLQTSPNPNIANYVSSNGNIDLSNMPKAIDVTINISNSNDWSYSPVSAGALLTAGPTTSHPDCSNPNPQPWARSIQYPLQPDVTSSSMDFIYANFKKIDNIVQACGYYALGVSYKGGAQQILEPKITNGGGSGKCNPDAANDCPWWIAGSRKQGS